jgi:hypothetical protein
MTTLRSLFMVFIALLMLAPGRAFAAQQHIVSPDAIATTTADHSAAQDSDRAAIREALARPEVRSAAAKLGVDMARIDGAVSTLSGDDLQRAASTAREVNDQLLGGANTVTISTTTIIIVLLVIILIVVIAR